MPSRKPSAVLPTLDSRTIRGVGWMVTANPALLRTTTFALKKRSEVIAMDPWKKRVGGALLLVFSFAFLLIGFPQIDIHLPSTSPTYSGNAIDFGPVPVGTTKSATYIFKILETSETPGTVTQISFPGGYLSSGPFALKNLPSLPVTIPPGGSITFNVTFTPTAVTSYTASFTIVAQGGSPLQVKRQVVTLTGAGITGAEQVPQPTQPTYDLTALQSRIDAIATEVNALEQKLDNLAALIGQWTAGEPFHVKPGTLSQNPPPPTEGLAPGIADIQKRLDKISETLSAQPVSAAELPPVTVSPEAGKRFRDFMTLADKLLVATAQDLLAINPEDEYTQKILQDHSNFVLAGRAEVSQLIGLSQELSPQAQAYLDYVVVDGAPEILYDITSGKSPSPKHQVQLDADGNEVVSTILSKAGDILSSLPAVGGLFQAVLSDAAKLFEGNTEFMKLLSGMSLAQLELELKLDAIVRGLFGVEINETMDESALRERLRRITLGDIPTRLERLSDGVESNSQKIDDLADELRAKMDNLARELGLTLRGLGYQVEPGASGPNYTGPNYNGSSLADRIELLRVKLDNLARILGLALYGKEMGFPNGFNIEPGFHTTPAGEGPTYPPIKPEIKNLESEVKIIKEKLEEILRRLTPEGVVPSPDKAPPVIVPPQPPQGFYEYATEQLAQTKKIYVYAEGVFTAGAAGDYKNIDVTTAAFDLSGWIDLSELRDGDAVTVTVAVSVAGGPFRTWNTTTFSGHQARGLKYLTEFADGLEQMVGTNVRVTIAQTASADGFATQVPIYYQFIVESQD